MVSELLSEIRLPGSTRSAQNNPSMLDEQRDVSMNDRLWNEHLECEAVNTVLLCS